MRHRFKAPLLADATNIQDGLIPVPSSLRLALQKVPTSNTEGGWSFSLAEYVRHNDMPIYEASERVLRAFQDELMPAESLSEFFDVVG